VGRRWCQRIVFEKEAGSRREVRVAATGGKTYRGEALVGMKSKGSQLRRQNIVLELIVVVGYFIARCR